MINRGLSSKNKHKLFQSSAHCLRIVCKDYMRLFSHIELHILCNRALPLQWSDYVSSTIVQKILTSEKPEYLYGKLNEKLIYHDRTDKLYTRPSNKLKIGLNCISNRSMHVMKRFHKSDFVKSSSFFKSLAKKKFLNPTN